MEIEIAGKKFRADIRWARDLKPVLAFPNVLRENFPAYYMFRDLYYSRNDRKKMLEHRLRFDLTVIPPGKIGREFIKTFGHYHPPAEGNLSYAEMYEVLSGEAIYLLQKFERGKITDVVVVEAKAGDKVIIPPNYGHVTINPSNKELRMVNWVCRDFKSDYELYRRLKGACYYYTEDEWVKNPNYSDVPEIRFVKPKIPKELGLKRSEEMYKLVKDPSKLEFLVRPSKYLEMFEWILE